MQTALIYTRRVFATLAPAFRPFLFRLTFPFTLPFTFLLVLPPSVFAQACPANQYSVCLGESCVCIPQLDGDLEVMAAQAIKTLEAARAPALATWLQTSRNDSFLESMPIPPLMRDALTGYVADDVLTRARFLVADTTSDTLNLGDMTIRFGQAVNGFDIEAITLIDVIVFRNAEAAQNDAALWAHELAHVKQYLDWGVDEFANRYVTDPVAVEDEAYRAADAYKKWKQDKGIE